MWDMGLSVFDIDDLDSRDVVGLLMLTLSLAQKVLIIDKFNLHNNVS